MNKLLSALLLAVLLPFGALASDCSGYNTTNCMKQGGSSLVIGGTEAVRTGGSLTVESGGSLTVNSGATATIAGTVNQTGVALGVPGAVPSANPLVQVGYYDILIGSANTPTNNNLMASATGVQITPVGFVATASGSAATCTNVGLYCSGVTGAAPWGNKIATIPVAALVDNVPVTEFATASAVAIGSAAGRGCPSGQGLVVSAAISGGACTTTTDIFLQLLYIPNTTTHN